MVILGIDPGSVRIGYGLIKKEVGGIKHLESGLFKLPPARKEDKLLALEKEIKTLIRKFQPDLGAVEKLYFTKNRKTGLEVAQARGVIIATLAKANLPFVELAPSEVKLAAAGHGQAAKSEVAKMVFLTLKLPQQRQIDDATDALAIAIAALTLKRG